MDTPTTIYDIVILGASGFTGKYVIREALRFLNSPHSPLKTLAIAGRTPPKLSHALAWAAAPNQPPPVPILAADATDASSLRRIASQARIILNCVGPFRLYGDAIVAACVDAGCDYLDICGEPVFVERMGDLYREKAAQKGSLMVPACGFNSVPADLGFLFNSRQWVSPAAPNRVEAYLVVESSKRVVASYSAYKSVVHGAANANHAMQTLRRSWPTRKPRPPIPGPPPCEGGLQIEYEKKLGLWGLKLPSADPIVVGTTLATLHESPHGLQGINESKQQIETRKTFWSSVKPAHFGHKLGTKSLFKLVPLVILGIFLGLFAKFSLGRRLLLAHPSFFSLGAFNKDGASEEQVASASFKMWFVGRGFSNSNGNVDDDSAKPDMEIITRVMGPEFGCRTTSITLVQCALAMLSQRDALPKGGVYTPGIVFGPTDLQNRLQENGISFDSISKGPLFD